MDSIDRRNTLALGGRPVVRAAANRAASRVREASNEVYFAPCETEKSCDLGNVSLDDTGRVMEIDMTVCGVCPNRQVAVGVWITEVDLAGNEHPRGFRAVTLPAHRSSTGKDVTVPTLRFILPDDQCEDGETVRNGRCRRFRVRAEQHYLDSDVSL